MSEIEAELLHLYADETLDEKPELLKQRGGAGYSEAAVELIASLLGSAGRGRHVINLRNGGALPFLADDAVVEVPAWVEPDGVRPRRAAAARPARARPRRARDRVRGARARRRAARRPRARVPRAARAPADRPVRRRRDARGQADRRQPEVSAPGRSDRRRRRQHQDGSRWSRRSKARCVASLRGPGSNSHGLGSAGAVAVIASLVDGVAFDRPAEHGAFFLCGADVEQDIAELSAEIEARSWARAATVDNDTFALLRAGTDRPDAVAVICGAGINCVGRRADGRVARYPSLGWETGDWGGAEAVGREALFLAARAEDGRGEADGAVGVVRSHFELPSAYAVGEAVHYRRLRDVRLGELAPAVVAAAGDGDAVARALVERLANEIVLMVRRALADLELEEADVVLGGGMLARGEGFLHERVVGGVAARSDAGRARYAAGRGCRARRS